MAVKRVLVVDDSDADQFIARMVISEVAPGVEVVQARDGQQALQILAEQTPESFGLILLDVNMPRMDGYGFLEAYSADGRTAPVVVMLTSSNQTEDRRRTQAFACVTGYQVKPLSPDWVAQTFT